MNIYNQKNHILFYLIYFFCLNNSFSSDFVSVGSKPIIMFDGPTNKSKKKFIAPPGMPLEIIFKRKKWARVRDYTNDLSWTQIDGLSKKRTIMIKNYEAKINVAPKNNSKIVFSALKGVILDLIEPVNSDWLKVKHISGEKGFVKVSNIWGF